MSENEETIDLCKIDDNVTITFMIIVTTANNCLKVDQKEPPAIPEN